MKKDIGNRNITKLFIKLLPVQILAIVSSSLSSIVNGGIVGNNLSAIDMSALGLITPFSAIISAIASIISGGMSIICGNLMGKGDNKKINAVFSVCVNCLTIVGSLLTAVCIALSNPISMFCGATSETLASTAKYLTGICVGIVPTLLIPSLMTFLQMANESTFSLIATVLLAVFNYLLDLLVIRVFKNGVFGIGLASSFASYISAFLMIIFIAKKKIVKYNFKESDLASLKQVIIYGLPFALASFLYSIRNIYINNISQSVGGVIAINALAIVSSIGGFVDSFNIGIGAAYRMLASVYVGERDSNSIKRLFKNTLIISEIIILIKVAIMFIFGKDIAIAFGASGETIELTAKLIKYYAISSPFNIPTIYLISTYLSLGKSNYCNFLYLINAFIVPIGCCYISSKTIGIDGVFSCYYISEIIVLTVIFAVAMIKNKKIKLSFEQLFSLDSNFDTENKLSISINLIEQVVNTSVEIEQFCLKQGIDKRRAKLAGLCLEEMASNIATHGFNKDNKKHSIDIFVCIENNEISVRIKDDCVGFDPNTRASIYNPEDPCKNVGIRLVSKVSKQMNYQTTFGMNVLTINL